MMIGIPLAPRSIEALVQRHGGELRHALRGTVRRVVPTPRANAGDLTVLLHARYIDEAIRAASRGAFVLVDAVFASRPDVSGLPAWIHPHAAYALAELLDTADAPADVAEVGADCKIGPGVQLLPRVRIGARVTIGAGAIIGAPGFGFATGPDGKTREIPQLGGVIIEDDVHIGSLSTIASGTIGPTIIRRGAKIDAQVHLAHNCEVGAGTIIAAQSGIAGSVTIGAQVLIGGQVGIADHLTVGDGARIAAKSGVIGDVAPGATVAGYPAVDRGRWLRGLAELYRLAQIGEGSPTTIHIASSAPPRSKAGSDAARAAATIPAPPDRGAADTAPPVSPLVQSGAKPPIPRDEP